MNWKENIKKGFTSDWAIALILLLIFLGAKGYKYGWDDQHLEIPLLKSLIDGTLYPGDYYVTALKTNFVSYFYVLLSRLITVAQIPAAYFTLYLLSKYFLFFWIYKLWKFVSGQKSAGFVCTLVFMFFGRVPEFHYRTFSHQEFTLAIIAAGIYYFYRERFILASLIFGLAANFHLIYSAIPMSYLVVYLALNTKKHGWLKLIRSVGTCLLFVMPVLIWAIKKNLPAYGLKGDGLGIPWINVYKLACPQNFIFFGLSFKYMFSNFNSWFSVMQNYLLIIVLFVFNHTHNRHFRDNKKNYAVFMAAFALLTLTYVFTYIKPVRFVLDLNLVRNTQFLFLILMGYTAVFTFQTIKDKKLSIAYYAALMFGFTVLSDTLAMLAIISLSAFLSLESARELKTVRIRKLAVTLAVAVIIMTFSGMAWLMSHQEWPAQKIFLSIIAVISAAFILNSAKLNIPRDFARPLFVILPLIALCSYNFYYHYTRINLETKAGGFWKLQRDWEDMQKFTRNNTPKTATLLVPNDMEMGGFRILSERTIICCYRDCGVAGFDYPAVIEWLKRLHDIEPFKVVLERKSDLTIAVAKAIFKYKADYIVFMRYYEPPENPSNPYEKIYQNDSFSLFKVKLPA